MAIILPNHSPRRSVTRIALAAIAVALLVTAFGARAFAVDNDTTTGPDMTPSHAGVKASDAGKEASLETTYTLTLRNHQFTPDRLEVPAGKKIMLHVINLDDAAEEFESHDLKREKIVPAKGSIKVSVGPLKAGSYGFFGEFHEATAKGTLVAVE